MEKLAGEELATHLQRLYPDQHFSVTTTVSSDGPRILLGTLKSQPKLSRYVPEARLTKPESFVITTAREGNAEIGVVAGEAIIGIHYS